MKKLMKTNSQSFSSLNLNLGVKTMRTYIDNRSVFFLLKRTFDVIVSLTVIIFLLSWFIPLMAIAIKLSSKGPVFFIQRRVGRGIKSFGCIKFRTMVLNNQADSEGATENDKRITRLGKFLRITSLDELPQVINVLIGDMSIVGPRPHMFADCDRFSNYIQNYKFRNLVRPGITGLAQVKGFRGPAEDPYFILTRFYYDTVYIQHIGVGMDLNIFLNTGIQIFKIIFSKRSIRKGNLKNVTADSRKIAA
jgi:putative colanic acid biosynthesis UDP-glucose lipid carrier transferase